MPLALAGADLLAPFLRRAVFSVDAEGDTKESEDSEVALRLMRDLLPKALQHEEIRDGRGKETGDNVTGFRGNSEPYLAPFERDRSRPRREGSRGQIRRTPPPSRRAFGSAWCSMRPWAFVKPEGYIGFSGLVMATFCPWTSRRCLRAAIVF
jgi:hypothetical protein